MSVRSGVAPRPRLTARAALLGALVLVLALALMVPMREYFAQRSQVAELEARVELLQRERNRIERQIERYEDPEYLEFLARKCLGMVKPGEISFVAVPEGGRASPSC